jgi:hypothetical protein
VSTIYRRAALLLMVNSFYRLEVCLLLREAMAAGLAAERSRTALVVPAPQSSAIAICEVLSRGALVQQRRSSLALCFANWKGSAMTSRLRTNVVKTESQLKTQSWRLTYSLTLVLYILCTEPILVPSFLIICLVARRISNCHSYAAWSLGLRPRQY